MQLCCFYLVAVGTLLKSLWCAYWDFGFLGVIFYGQYAEKGKG